MPKQRITLVHSPAGPSMTSACQGGLGRGDGLPVPSKTWGEAVSESSPKREARRPQLQQTKVSVIRERSSPVQVCPKAPPQPSKQADRERETGNSLQTPNSPESVHRHDCSARNSTYLHFFSFFLFFFLFLLFSIFFVFFSKKKKRRKGNKRIERDNANAIQRDSVAKQN